MFGGAHQPRQKAVRKSRRRRTPERVARRGKRLLLTRVMHPCRPTGRVGALRGEAEGLEHPFESLELPQGINHGGVIVFWGPIEGRWKNDHLAEQLIGHPELRRCPRRNGIFTTSLPFFIIGMESGLAPLQIVCDRTTSTEDKAGCSATFIPLNLSASPTLRDLAWMSPEVLCMQLRSCQSLLQVLAGSRICFPYPSHFLPADPVSVHCESVMLEGWLTRVVNIASPPLVHRPTSGSLGDVCTIHFDK